MANVWSLNELIPSYSKHISPDWDKRYAHISNAVVSLSYITSERTDLDRKQTINWKKTFSLALFHFHISFFHGNKVQCLLNVYTLKSLHHALLFIWYVWTWAAHLVLILQLACWSELPCFIGSLVRIYINIYHPSQSSLTSHGSLGARGYFQEALCGHGCCLLRWHCSAVCVLFV